MKLKDYLPFMPQALIRTLIILGFCLIFFGIGIIIENLTPVFKIIAIIVFPICLYVWMLHKTKRDKSQIFHAPDHNEIDKYVRRCIVIKYRKHNIRRHDEDIKEPDLILQIFDGEDIRNAYLKGFNRSSQLSGHSL